MSGEGEEVYSAPIVVLAPRWWGTDRIQLPPPVSESTLAESREQLLHLFRDVLPGCIFGGRHREL